jgi:hypothetical protein
VAIPNDRDEEWADFIDYLKAEPAYEYTRTDFLDAASTKTTTYNSGSMTVTIVALRDGDANTAKRVDFTAIFRNEDLGYILVDPIQGYWNYGPWEAP